MAHRGAMQLQDEKHYMTITNWPKGADESSAEDNMFTFVLWEQHIKGKRKIPPSVLFFQSKQYDPLYFRSFIILSLSFLWLCRDFSSSWLWLERWETHKQGVCCYLAHRIKTQATPPSSSCLGANGKMSLWGGFVIRAATSVLWQPRPVWLSVRLNRLVVAFSVPSRLWADWYAHVLWCVNRHAVEIALKVEW